MHPSTGWLRHVVDLSRDIAACLRPGYRHIAFHFNPRRCVDGSMRCAASFVRLPRLTRIASGERTTLGIGIHSLGLLLSLGHLVLRIIVRPSCAVLNVCPFRCSLVVVNQDELVDSKR